MQNARIALALGFDEQLSRQCYASGAGHGGARPMRGKGAACSAGCGGSSGTHCLGLPADLSRKSDAACLQHDTIVISKVKQGDTAAALVK
jgi:hypothetical protein